jgi:cytochrome c-type biogenesis protein CcmH/NrfG
MSTKPKRKNRLTGKVAKSHTQAQPQVVAKKKGTKTSTKADKDKRKKRIAEVAVVIFAVIMVATMLLPSFSSIFTSSSSTASSTDAATTTASTDSATTAATTTSSMDTLDAKYSSTVATLETKLDSDPENLATLINLANTYFQWGYQATSYATTDETTAHMNDLLTKAEGYYDRYLALNDSPSAHVNRALCQHYAGDTDGAISALEAYTQTNPDFGPAWANLGLVYMSASRTDDATAAFQKAIDTDPDDKYGAKSYAEQYLSYIESASTASTSSSSSSSSSSGTSTSKSLSDALAGVSGTTL